MKITQQIKPDCIKPFQKRVSSRKYRDSEFLTIPIFLFLVAIATYIYTLILLLNNFNKKLSTIIKAYTVILTTPIIFSLISSAFFYFLVLIRNYIIKLVIAISLIMFVLGFTGIIWAANKVIWLAVGIPVGIVFLIYILLLWLYSKKLNLASLTIRESLRSIKRCGINVCFSINKEIVLVNIYYCFLLAAFFNISYCKKLYNQYKIQGWDGDNIDYNFLTDRQKTNLFIIGFVDFIGIIIFYFFSMAVMFMYGASLYNQLSIVEYNNKSLSSSLTTPIYKVLLLIPKQLHI